MDLNTQQPMVAFARLTKVDESKRLIYGRAVQEFPDRSDEEFDYAGSKPYFQAWSKSQLEASVGKSAGNVRAMHGKVAAGVVLPDGLTFNDAEKAIDVVTHVTDDQEWRKVMSGTYTGFSIGGKYISKSAPDKSGIVRYIADPSEISLVDRPCGKTSTFFDVIKADGTSAQQAFKVADDKAEVTRKEGESDDDFKTRQDAAAEKKPAFGGDSEKAQLVRADGVVLDVHIAKAALPKPGASFDHEGRTYALIKIDGDKAMVELVYEVTGSPDDVQAFAKALAERGMSIAEATKRVVATPTVEQIAVAAIEIAKAENIELDKADDKAKADLRKRAQDSLTKGSVTPAFGETVFADETNRRFPVDSEGHIRAAWKYINLPNSYKPGEAEAVKKNIIAAAAAKGITLEDGKAVVAAFEKAIEAIGGKIAKADGKDGVKKDSDEGKAIGAKAVDAFMLKGLATCGQLAYVLDSLAQLASSVEMERAAEGDSNDVVDALYAHIAGIGQALSDLIVHETKEEVAGGGMAALEAMQKVAKGMVERIEKNYTAVRATRIQKLHDMSLGMGAKCATGDMGKLAKAYTDDDLAKIVGETVEKRVGALTEQLEKASKRIESLEAQPMPSKVQLRVAALTKGEDGADNNLAAFNPVFDSYGKVNVLASVIKAQQAGVSQERAMEVLSKYIDPDTGVSK